MTGLYKCKPDRKYRGSLHWDNMYHCCNWTFKPYEIKEGKIIMKDTYWSGGDGVRIELTNENFEEFELLFDFNDVKPHSGTNISDYDSADYWHVAIDSGGMYCGGKYFIKNNAVKNKDKVLERLIDEINLLENRLAWKKSEYEQVKSGETDLKFV